MSKFRSVVPVPLGEIRRLDGKLGASAIPGQLVTAIGSFTGGSSTHTQSDYPNAVFDLNGAANKLGVMIVMEQEDIVDMKISDAYEANSHVRAHVLKSGEEVTVVLASGEAVVAGAGLAPAASGKVVVTATAANAMFSAIETATAGSSGDGLRILARVL